jgi:hypothetical protein
MVTIIMMMIPANKIMKNWIEGEADRKKKFELNQSPKDKPSIKKKMHRKKRED